MLCSTLIKKTFFGYAFMLMLPAAALSPTVGYSLPASSTLPENIFAASLPDTTGAALSDSTATPLAPKISLNHRVAPFVEAYLKKEEKFLQKIKVKSRPLFQTIEKVFLQYELPLQLKYLAVVESALQSKAQSGEGARGLWQLMPQTAKELGLRVSGKTDERLHPYRSTIAAAKYLRRLYAEFGDWLLVLAAYNGGPGKVYQAMKKSGSKNFWVLQRYLPAESRGHVKRFIGIHWFFEGEGSITTQTRAEATAWQESLLTAQAQASL